MGGRHSRLHHLAVPRPSPSGPGQGVRVRGQRGGVFAAVGVDPGEVDGSFDLGESLIRGFAECSDIADRPQRQPARPERVALG